MSFSPDCCSCSSRKVERSAKLCAKLLHGALPLRFLAYAQNSMLCAGSVRDSVHHVVTIFDADARACSAAPGEGECVRLLIRLLLVSRRYRLSLCANQNTDVTAVHLQLGVLSSVEH